MDSIPSTVWLKVYTGEASDLLTTPLAWFADEVAAGSRPCSTAPLFSPS